MAADSLLWESVQWETAPTAQLDRQPHSAHSLAAASAAEHLDTESCEFALFWNTVSVRGMLQLIRMSQLPLISKEHSGWFKHIRHAKEWNVSPPAYIL